ncbi:Hypothetical_protein [Hexamita inflata]|uniref:Hypothetical_protein n=1 Tax=Hexamita inflata TaxID=28002 RepID=A0AA86PI46_9EUKA|nr:Hypothetical protein HINF_LOCUS23935 [Hexamita inflata]
MNCVQNIMRRQNVAYISKMCDTQYFVSGFIYSMPQRINNSRSSIEFLNNCKLLFDNASAKYVDYSESIIINTILQQIFDKHLEFTQDPRFRKLIDSVLFYFAKQSVNTLFNSSLQIEIIQLLSVLSPFSSENNQNFSVFLGNFVEDADSALKILCFVPKNVKFERNVDLFLLSQVSMHLADIGHNNNIKSQLINIFKNIQIQDSDPRALFMYYKSAVYLEQVQYVDLEKVLQMKEATEILPFLIPYLDEELKFKVKTWCETEIQHRNKKICIHDILDLLEE